MKKNDKSRLIALKDDKILVLEKIAAEKRYTLAGGLKKRNESYKESLIRETFEEIGCHLKKKNLTYFISRKSIDKDGNIVYKHYYYTTKKIKKTTNLEPHKFKNILWVSWQEALNYLDKEDRIAVSLYFGGFKEKDQTN